MANHEFALRAGECEAGNFLTNHYQRNRGYGGHLFITNERLVFIPVAASRSRGALRSEFDLRQVSVAEVVARGSGPRDGGALRRRLKVSTFSGDIEYFVVWRPKKLAAIINGVAAQAR